MDNMFPENWSAEPAMAMVERGGADTDRMMTPGDPGLGGYDDAMMEVLNNPSFVPGYLSMQIGRTVRVEFEVGPGLTDRVGTLIGVGAGFILLREPTSGATILCDLSPVRFVTIVDESGPVLIQ